MKPRWFRAALAASVLASLLPVAAAAQAPGLRSAYSRDGIDVWAVGDSGTVYRSVNGGAIWMSRTLGATTLRGVAARNLTVLVVGDSGKVWRSLDSGGTWSLSVRPGAPDLRGLEMVTNLVGYAVGEAGTLLATGDGGASWSALDSGTGASLNAVRFADPSVGWAVGDGGTVLKTVDGGASWTPIAVPTTQPLYSVAASGSLVWVVGAQGTALTSDDGGAHWTAPDLKLSYHPDLTAAWIQPPSTVFLAGGNGFIRSSADGGFSWQFAIHPMQAPISALFFNGNRGWATSSGNRVVISTTDGGATWTLPQSAFVSRSWVQKLSFVGSARGRSIDINPLSPSTFLIALGDQVFRSLDEGEHWSPVASIPQCTKVNSFLISPTDSSVWVAAVAGVVARRLVKSDDYGQSWFTTLTHDFGEYGIPMALDTDRPDTVWFGGDSDGLYRSTDGGKNWSVWSTTTFRSPCNIVVVPDSASIMLVGDGITGSGQGQYYKSTDWGQTFTLESTRPFGTSEIPGMVCSRLRNAVTFGTNWGSGGVQRSSDYGATWPNVHNAGATWGVDIAKDDPNCVIFGQYSGGQTYLSLDGGTVYANIPIVGSNYSFYARDRGLILAEQSNGVYKLQVGYQYTPNNLQAVTVTFPNGGEYLPAGSVQNITWSSQNLPLARVEYRRAPGEAWQPLAEVAGYIGSYSWSVPHDATTLARVRVVDAWDGAPVDSSDNAFTIALPLIASAPDSLDFGPKPIGSQVTMPMTLHNPGTGSLTISSITTSGGAMWPGRHSLILFAGLSDTVGVNFGPNVVGNFVDTLVINSNAYDQPQVRLPLAGTSYDTTGVVISVNAPAGGETWLYGTVQDIAWSSTVVPNVTLEYQTDPVGPWKPIAIAIPAGSSPFPWTIPPDTTDFGRVRVRDAFGTRYGVSDGAFHIVTPLLAAHPVPFDMYLTLVGTTRADRIQIDNPGAAPLTISSISSSNPHFWTGRGSLALPARAGDTLGVFFNPAVDGPDSTVLTLLADDPESPHLITVRAVATSNVAVGGPSRVDFALWQNEPNPFADATLIRYALPAEARVSLEVFNLQGQRVASLVHGIEGAGVHSVRFGPALGGAGRRSGPLPAGVYFYRVQAGAYSSTRKMLLLR